MKTQIRFENSEYRVYQGNDTEHFSPIENSDLLKAEIEEIRKYSITPTTFDSRSFFNQSTADRIRETIEKVTINKTGFATLFLHIKILNLDLVSN